MRAWLDRNPERRAKDNARRKAYAEQNPHIRLNWEVSNQERIKANRKAKQPKTRERMRKWYADTGYNAKYYAKNKESMRKQMRAYYHANKAAIRAAIKADPFYAIKKAQRHALERIKKMGGNKDSASVKYLGCSWSYARNHIESLFLPGMSWANHGQWEIDHKTPLSAFDLSKPEQIAQASRWDNLQPLWKTDNRTKHAKWTEFQPELRLIA